VPAEQIKDPFAHEAAHALAYDALGLPIEWVRVELDHAGKGSGRTERGSNAQITYGSGVLEFMVGAGVLVRLFGQSFDTTVTKFKSDLCTLLDLLGNASEEQGRIHLARLRRATYDFVGEWVLLHKDPIMKLAILLKQSPVGSAPEIMRWQLSGADLDRAMQKCWGRQKPEPHFTKAFADARWKAIVECTDPLPVAEAWQDSVLRHCSKGKATEQ
jgi:hypothetical protein